MFARYELCGFKYDLLNGKQTQPCQITVVTELVEYETKTVLAKRSRTCPSQNHKSVVTENDVSDRELQNGRCQAGDDDVSAEAIAEECGCSAGGKAEEHVKD